MTYTNIKNTFPSNNNIIRVSKDASCNHCGKPDWCYRLQTSDGNLLEVCNREAPPAIGWYETNQRDRDGKPYYALESTKGFNQSSYPKILNFPRKTKKEVIKPAPMPSTPVELGELKDIEIPQKVKKGNTTEITYPYSNTQWVLRTDYYDDNGNRIDKKPFPYHLSNDGKNIKGKGDKPWNAYRLDEVIAVSNGKWVLGQEGEQCVEIARSLGIPSITWQGGSWTDEDIQRDLTALKDSGIAGYIYLPDNDKPGTDKAEKVQKAAIKIQFPVIVLDPLTLWDRMPEKGDLCDWVTSMQNNGLSIEEIGLKVMEGLLAEAERTRLDSILLAESIAEDEETSNLPINGILVKDESVELVVLREKFDDKWMVFKDAFYLYSGHGYWNKIDDEQIHQIITDTLSYCYQLGFTKEGEPYPKFIYATDSKAKSCFGFIRKKLVKSDIPSNNHLRCFNNCTVDFRTGEELAHSKNHYIIGRIPYDYKKQSEIPENFKAFISSAFGSELIPLIRAVTSMLIDPTAPYGFFPHIIGASGSGKGTLLRLWSQLFDEQNVTTTTSFTDLQEKDKRHQTLTGVNFCYFPDMAGFANNLQGFYELIDNGMLSGRALFSSSTYNKKWNCRFAIGSVNPLQIENSGLGWQRRSIPIPTQPRQGKPDPNLAIKLENEKADIISWALSMPREERDRYLLEPDYRHESVKALQLDQSIFGDSVRSFIDSCLNPSDSEFDNLSILELHDCYKIFCKNLGYSEFSYNKFISQIKEALPERFTKAQTTRVDGNVVRTKAGLRFTKLNTSFVKGHGIDEGWLFIKTNCESGNLSDLIKRPRSLTTTECNGSGVGVTGCNGYEEKPETRVVTGCNGCNGVESEREFLIEEKNQGTVNDDKKSIVPSPEKPVTPVTTHNSNTSSDLEAPVTPHYNTEKPITKGLSDAEQDGVKLKPWKGNAFPHCVFYTYGQRVQYANDPVPLYVTGIIEASSRSGGKNAFVLTQKSDGYELMPIAIGNITAMKQP